jgi:7-dehydrocholesterol reductase
MVGRAISFAAHNAAASAKRSAKIVAGDAVDATSDDTGFLTVWRHTLCSIAMLTLPPPFAIIFWHTCAELDGSIVKLGGIMLQNGIWQTLVDICGPVFWGSPMAWKIIGIFAVSQLILMRVVPGAEYRGPLTPKGHTPVYKANGVACFVITVAAFAYLSDLTQYSLALFAADIAYVHFGCIVGALNVSSFAFCFFLYVKGIHFPSGPDHGTTGNFIFDYYWGTELFPRVLGWDLKMFTNCRFGMMSWPVLLLSYAAAQSKMSGLSTGMIVAIAVQYVYLTKFYIWETGYLSSIDIMHDRAGYYICWGCLVWVPTIYTSHTLYMVRYPANYSYPVAVAMFLVGAAAVLINFAADKQRQSVRATDGKCLIWGKPPVIIRATWTTEEGDERKSILLVSGWWKIARHFHYVPEILGAFFWTLPAGFEHGLPWFYVIFLIILLTDRSFRDDRRCAAKYGKFWDQYKAAVPYKIIPGIV